MKRELPIRSKLEIVEKIPEVLASLHGGNRKLLLGLMEELKLRSIFLDEAIQKGVLTFINQVLFQYDYDPWHKVTKEVTRAADDLIEEMGFHSPSA